MHAIAMPLLAAAAHTVTPIPTAPVTVGPGTWITLAGTIATSVGAVVTLLIKARSWLNSAVRASDGRSLAQVVEQNSNVLATLASKVDQLADDVHEVRGHQHGLADRVTRVETRLDDYLEPRPPRRRR